MIKIAWHPLYAHPLPEGHRFPMLKYELIPEQLLHEGTIVPQNLFHPEPVSEDIILLSHEKAYWEQLRDLTLSAKDQRRIGFPLNAQLVERELRITQGTIDGAHFAIDNGIAFNVAGGTHHAGSHWGEGFCLLNDQAIAANYLLYKKLVNRILIIDLDVHQGNGTAEIFQRESRVFTFSMHGEKNFPFKKEVSSLDVPLSDGMEDDEYLSALYVHLKKAFESAKPDFVFYLSGVDVLSTDKLGKLALTRAACKERDKIVLQACKNKSLPLQVSMGGGYSVDIRDIVDAHCNTYRLAFDLFG
ncbi:histone deacetylase [Pedobacter sp. KLB.chiD]|uniref:histone deacetylase family protein n=1 Tax=Pedobacter sp. KLB.chiD TaxID=3387402 RepID=UPI00399A8A20